MILINQICGKFSTSNCRLCEELPHMRHKRFFFPGMRSLLKLCVLTDDRPFFVFPPIIFPVFFGRRTLLVLVFNVFFFFGFRLFGMLDIFLFVSTMTVDTFLFLFPPLFFFISGFFGRQTLLISCPGKKTTLLCLMSIREHWHVYL